jgi:hypothetical protein
VGSPELATGIRTRRSGVSFARSAGKGDSAQQVSPNEPTPVSPLTSGFAGGAKHPLPRGDLYLLRPAITLPLEIYTEERIQEFDDEERELAKVLAAKDRG